MDIKVKHHNDTITIHTKTHKANINVNLIKNGNRLYVKDFNGHNIQAVFEPTLQKVKELAKEMNCKLITADVMKQKKVIWAARKAGMRISPRILLGLKHVPKGHTIDFGKGKTVPMHKRVK